jgi:hypothetical protein
MLLRTQVCWSYIAKKHTKAAYYWFPWDVYGGGWRANTEVLITCNVGASWQILLPSRHLHLVLHGEHLLLGGSHLKAEHSAASLEAAGTQRYW